MKVHEKRRQAQSGALPHDWSGPDDTITASEVAASIAVRDVGPRPGHREDVWAAARAHAWELLEDGRIRTWSGLRTAARRHALSTALALAHWRPEGEVRRGGFGSRGDAPEVIPLDPASPRWLDSPDPPSTGPGATLVGDLHRLREILDRIVDELAERGLDAERARLLVDLVIDHPEVRRGAARARRRLEDQGLADIAAAALVTLILGYPTRAVPGLIERELRGRDGWGHPCVPRLLDLVVHPRGRRLRGMWQEP